MFSGATYSRPIHFPFSMLNSDPHRFHAPPSQLISGPNESCTFCLADYEYCTEKPKSKYGGIVFLWQSRFVASETTAHSSQGSEQGIHIFFGSPSTEWQMCSGIPTNTHISLFFNSFRHCKTRRMAVVLAGASSETKHDKDKMMTFSPKKCRSDVGVGDDQKRKSSPLIKHKTTSCCVFAITLLWPTFVLGSRYVVPAEEVAESFVGLPSSNLFTVRRI